MKAAIKPTRSKWRGIGKNYKNFFYKNIEGSFVA